MNNTTEFRIYRCPSMWPLEMPWSHLITWAVGTCILSLIVIISNSALIYSLYKTQQLATVTNRFVLLMTISDLGTGIVYLPLLVVMISLKNTVRSCIFELFLQYIAFMFAYFSFFMLMSISLDRYIHVTKLNNYNRFMNNFRMKIIIVISVVSAVILPYISVALPSFSFQLAINSLSIIFVGYMFLLYSLVFRKVSVHAQRCNQIGNEAGINQTANQESRKRMSALKTIRLVLVALMLLYLPYNFIQSAWWYYKLYKNEKPPFAVRVAAYFSYELVISNSAVNAILIGYGNNAVKRFLLNRIWPQSSVDVGQQ